LLRAGRLLGRTKSGRVWAGHNPTQAKRLERATQSLWV
jgi:hypothetical protein